MNFKKAQTATEYMIILAVIIIIALIVVGVMGGIPGLGGSTRSRAASSYWQSADLGIVAFAASATGENSSTAKIRNNMRDSITITNTSLDGGLVYTTDTVLAPGETKTFSIKNVSGCSATGDSFTFDVAINYTNDETGAKYEFTGDGNKMEGKCAT